MACWRKAWRPPTQSVALGRTCSSSRTTWPAWFRNLVVVAIVRRPSSEMTTFPVRRISHKTFLSRKGTLGKSHMIIGILARVSMRDRQTAPNSAACRTPCTAGSTSAWKSATVVTHSTKSFVLHSSAIVRGRDGSGSGARVRSYGTLVTLGGGALVPDSSLGSGGRMTPTQQQQQPRSPVPAHASG